MGYYLFKITSFRLQTMKVCMKVSFTKHEKSCEMIANPVLYLYYDVRSVMLVHYLMPNEVITSVKVRGLHCFPGCAIVKKL